jgi:predicted dehydrogenase
VCSSDLNEQEICVVGHEGKVEAMVTEGVMRTGRRSEGLGSFTEQPIDDAAILHRGLHHGASYLEHVGFATAIRSAAPPAVTLHDGLMSVAVGVAAHISIDEGRPVTIEEVLHS